MKFSPGEVVLIWMPENGEEGHDFSYLHGEEAVITGPISEEWNSSYDYHIFVPCIDHDLIAKEHELRRKDEGEDEDTRELTCSWDDCVWSPYKQTEDA